MIDFTRLFLLVVGFCLGMLLIVLTRETFGVFHKRVHYKAEFVDANATGTAMDYLNEQGVYGWDLQGMWDYQDGRLYIFQK